jgi:uncharacterized membrane protein YkvA (DUF1232 family)
MLNALKHQLLELAKDSSGSFAMEIEKRVGTDKAPRFISEMRNFILVAPEMIAQIRAWSDDPNIPSKLKNLHGFLLTYLYHPKDFLNYETYGLLGYLDDTYFAGRIYEETMNGTNYSARRYLPNQQDLGKYIHSWLEQTREIIPKETSEIDKMMDELLQGKFSAFSKTMA